ncbi:G1 family glutamic endopeptidase [Leifsonia sp. NPDC058194]|uniref:G1 family glutamic endopeptidase n=1 Tax=Leifsonia sp. NPDC058194 TaxID=3346374 RepID=UPI0036D90864
MTAAIAAGALIAGVVMPTAASAAPSPTALDHSQSGCGENLTLHTPASVGGQLYSSTAGSKFNTPILKKAAAKNVRWLSHITCKTVKGHTQPLKPPSAGGYGTPNWAGQVVDTSNWQGGGSLTPNYVQGEWTEPATALPDGYNSSASVIWPGLGGFCYDTAANCQANPPQLIQDGTYQLDQASSPTYLENHYFWYELFPQEDLQLVTNMTPNPGDDVATAVNWTSDGTANFTLCDYTQSTCLSGSQASPAPATTAEWVVERPTYEDGFHPLADFGNVTFTNADFQLSPNGQLEYNAATATTYDIQDAGTNDFLTDTGPLTATNDSFTTSWVAAF